jgi:hypothetical protein
VLTPTAASDPRQSDATNNATTLNVQASHSSSGVAAAAAAQKPLPARRAVRSTARITSFKGLLNQ